MAQTKKKKIGRRLVVPIALLLIILIAAYLFYSRGEEAPVVVQPPAEPPTETTPGTGTVHRQAVQPGQEGSPSPDGTPLAEDLPGETADSESPVPAEGPLEGEAASQVDSCAELQEAVRDFFSYVDERPYAEGVLTDTDSWSLFKNAVTKLSARPPASAGEGLDPLVMSKNIYHFFRTLNDRELTLAREVLRNEADTLEINLDLFFRWLQAADECSDPEGVCPSPEVLYKYSSFFMNTIGGRAYLFRRNMRLRLLVSYYAIRILHKADMEGRNRDGVDILPLAQDVRYGLSLQPDLYFRDNYLNKLSEIVQYHQTRR